jgi:hypothetical protein
MPSTFSVADSPSRFCLCALLVLHLHRLHGTFIPRLSDMSDTQADAARHRALRG